MIHRITTLLLCAINLIALFFFIDGKYINPGTKTLSRRDFLILLCIDAVFMLYFLFRKKALQKRG